MATVQRRPKRELRPVAERCPPGTCAPKGGGETGGGLHQTQPRGRAVGTPPPHSRGLVERREEPFIQNPAGPKALPGFA